jgi:pyruvate/2-oxoglutarate dehydrogenase complex dihydrolipoamide dehydrogenase (E3) component
MTEAHAREQHGDAVKTFHWPLAQGDRSVAENDTDGFVKLVYKGRGSLLGATIVAARAGEMITEVTVAMKHDISLSQLISVMHPYPAYTEIIQKAASQMLIGELFRGWTGRLARTAARLIT